MIPNDCGCPCDCDRLAGDQRWGNAALCQICWMDLNEMWDSSLLDPAETAESKHRRS